VVLAPGGRCRLARKHAPPAQAPLSLPPLPPSAPYDTVQAYWEFRLERLNRQKEFEEAAWASHHHQREQTANIYAVVNRLAAVLTEARARAGFLWA